MKTARVDDVADRSGAALAPAWPTLLGIQLVVLTIVAGTWWRLGPEPLGPPSDLDQRLLSMDVDASMRSVDAAIARASSAGALPVGAEAQERSFLSLLARSADLEPGAIALTPVAVDGAPQGVDASVELSGDAFGLPAFVDGLHRQHATVRLETIDAVIEPAGRMQATIGLHFHRPAVVDVSWIPERLALHHPGADRAAPVLERAAVLLSARQLAERDVAERAAASDVRVRAARDLPAALVRLRQDGGTLRWTPSEGLRARGAPR